jgi:Protein of unknown function (DUF1592)/Protein of unknown function (DUF1588)/Protein of unknown function (DUF1595)/Protein of unknown function (DUF1585)/Protein of unknown function (DUF1587)
MRFVASFRLACVISLGSVACTGTISGPVDSSENPDPLAGESGSGGGSGGVSGTNLNPALDCKGRSAVGPAPLVRLSNHQYLNTLMDLFPGIALPADKLTLPQESSTSGYSRVADVQAPSAALIDGLQRNAETVASIATTDLKKLLPCSPTDAATEASCGRTFLARFGKQVFRRPLTDEETTRYLTRFEDARKQWGFQSAITVLVSGLLQSPHFIYRPEFDSVGATEPAQVNSHALASRLAYFLTDGPPDAALMATADSGALLDAKVVETQARRLMTTPRARLLVAEFHRQWLQLDKTKDLKKAADLFPTFNTATASDLRQGVIGWLDKVFWDEGHTLSSFLTDNHALVNDALAPIYGVPTPGSKDLKWTEVPADQRSGILTQAGLLSAFAHQRNDAPVRRGVFVLDRLLCSAPPAPPTNVNTAAADSVVGSNLTTRQMLEQTHTVGACVGCHRSIDGAGFGFEHYDAVGAYRITESGQPVDATGVLIGTDVDGPFNGAIELGQKLASSVQVQRCVSAQWLAFALATTHEQLDECVVEPIVQHFASEGQYLRELLVAVATSDAFRFRPAMNP